MEYKYVTLANIDEEHICCSIASKKTDICSASKKEWMSQRLSEGLVFLKADVRGKAFIEYIPAHFAWCPIVAPNYMYIDCFWVSGAFQGQGIANELLTRCMQDAKEKGMNGLVIVSSKKKLPYLSDPAFLKYKGFQVADETDDYFVLLYLPFSENAPIPAFKQCTNTIRKEDTDFVLYFSNQCPFTQKYVAILEAIFKERHLPITIHKFTNSVEAQNAPSPFTIYSLYHKGKLITHEILSASKLNKILDTYEV